MLWTAAETAIRAHIEAAWAQTAYSAIPLVFDNEAAAAATSFVAIAVEGTWAEKSVYGSSGKRVSIEAGHVYIDAFVEAGTGKSVATGMVDAMVEILELQQLAGGICLEGANPSSSVASGADQVPAGQPQGDYYRCSGSVPFLVIGSR